MTTGVIVVAPNIPPLNVAWWMAQRRELAAEGLKLKPAPKEAVQYLAVYPVNGNEVFSPCVSLEAAQACLRAMGFEEFTVEE